MTRSIMGMTLAALILLPIAKGQEAARPKDFDVSDGKIDKAAGDHLIVFSKEMRATLKSNGVQKVRVPFTYLGPTQQVSHLGNGEIRHQFGFKLEAQDICNLIYAMWNFDTQKIAVTVKLNPGQHTHEQCLDRGYINDIKPRVWAPSPIVRAGAPHVLSAELEGQKLTVKTDDVIVWQGTLVPVVLKFKGPIGLRSDNARVVFDFLVGGR